MPFTAVEIAKHLGGAVIGNGSLVLKGFAPADRAQPGDLTFAENENYFVRAEQSAASAIIIEGPFSSERKVLIRVADARLAFAKVLPLFFPEPVFAPGIHPSAFIPGSAQVDPSAHIGPNCVIGENVKIGARCVLQAGDYIGAGCRLGEEVNIFPNVTLYPRSELGNRVRIHSGTVIGSDGFGYVPEAGAHVKVLQIGNVLIRDDVEIGANVTIDRGALGPTVIGRGTKIDNLVQIAHNVIVGEHCLIVSQTGVAGSSKLGNYVILGGQVGIAGHLKIGNRVSVAAQSGVMNNIPDGEKWIWTPAQPDRHAKRQMIALQQLPELLRRVAQLEKKLGVNPESEKQPESKAPSSS
ncbi:MAG TPA: UDP-3-O-(3-hydroxymyristoyl)glucosamine N-acyltransferase [Candidatus Limnocylindrales bacterium]|jgi:UDP-3-O-[3-hydroxymyristoyl] glucosamine N-acyltransferase|nr:UDP-3-O-(3-hydroxymyristoyl)glucosamine N-acyltransferase [Candidatus Limnocylindrales bacterium]